MTYNWAKQRVRSEPIGDFADINTHAAWHNGCSLTLLKATEPSGRAKALAVYAVGRFFLSIGV